MQKEKRRCRLFDDTAGSIDMKAADFKSGCADSAFAKGGFDSCYQFAGAERLGDIVIRAHIQSGDDTGFVAGGGQKDDGNILGFFDFRADRKAVSVGQRDVNQCEIEFAACERGKGLASCGGVGDGEAF